MYIQFNITEYSKTMVRLKEKKAEHYCCAYLRHMPESAISCAFMGRGGNCQSACMGILSDWRRRKVESGKSFCHSEFIFCHSELFFRHSERSEESSPKERRLS